MSTQPDQAGPADLRQGYPAQRQPTAGTGGTAGTAAVAAPAQAPSARPETAVGYPVGPSATSATRTPPAAQQAPGTPGAAAPPAPASPPAPAPAQGGGAATPPARSRARQQAGGSSRSRGVKGSQGATEADIQRAGTLLDRVARIFSQRVVGQDQLRTVLVTTLVSGGHVLLESVPGLAKTTAAQTLASAVSGSFRRIQCTPDLMPNDIVGTQILNYATGEMTTQLGPVHANIVLLDEINRSSAKTQSAMLEAMQERQTSIGGVVYPLPQPFMVLATQNPIEEEGTYVLPEAQMDRFLMKEVLTYPRPTEEVDVLDRISDGSFDRPAVEAPISTDDVEWLQATAERVYVDPVIKQYIVALVNTSRGGGPRPVPGLDAQVRVGASPRGGIALMKVAQAIALQEGRGYVIPDDVRLLRHAVLRHRLVLTYDALADAVAPESLIDAIFAAVPTP